MAKDYEIQTLSSRHYRIMDYMLAGWKLVDIAKTLSCTTQNLQDLKGSVLFQDELAQKRAILDSQVGESLARSVSDAEYVNERLAQGARRAVEKLVGFVDGTDDCSPSIARQAASDILDRSGYPKMTKTENTQNNIFVLDQDDLERIERTIELDCEQESKIIVKSGTETVTDAAFESGSMPEQ